MNQKPPSPEQGIILQNRSKLSITGVLEVIGFDDETVLLDTALGKLTVKGQTLKVISFTVETGHLLVEGNVAALVYTGQAKKGVLKRLFG